MPTKAFLHKKSLLDQFKDDYKSTGYIQSARAEHTWSNPLTRRKRTNKLNGWIKSFQGKRHVHKLARFNAMQNENLEEAMSLKGFLSNIGDKLVNKYGLDKNKVQNYLGSHTQEMQELLDDKELSLKEKVLFVRSEITGEKDEAKKDNMTYVLSCKVGPNDTTYCKNKYGARTDHIEDAWEGSDPDSFTGAMKQNFADSIGAEIADLEIISFEKFESKQSESLVLPNPTIIYRGTSEDAKKACRYVSKILADKGLGGGRVSWQAPKDGEFHYGHPEKDVYTVTLRGSNDLIKDSFAVYKDVFGNDFWNNCDADPQGWVDPLTINRYDVATPRQESKKSEFYMDDDDSEDYYYCHKCGRVTPSYELDAHDGFCSDCDARWTAEHENESKDTDEKLGYEKGHKNSRGEDAPWVIRSHEDNRILASFANKKDAEEHLKRMKQYSKNESIENLPVHEWEFEKLANAYCDQLDGSAVPMAIEVIEVTPLADEDGVLVKFDFDATPKGTSGTTYALIYGDLNKNRDNDLLYFLHDWQSGEVVTTDDIADHDWELANDVINPSNILNESNQSEAYVDNSATAQKDYVERVISAVQDYYGYSLFNAKNLVQSNYKKVLSWFESGNVDAVEAARCLGGKCEPTKKSEATGDKDVFTIDLYRIDDDGEENSIDDMQASQIIYDEDEAIKVANELADSYADDDGVVFAVVMAGEREKPNGDIVGEPFDIHWASSGNPEKTAEYRKKAGYAAFDNAMDYYAKQTESKKFEGIHLDFEDTIQVPEWLWKAYMLDDTADLEEDEIEKLNDFREKYKDYHLDDKSEDPYFSSRNDFDELGGNVYDVDAYKMSDKPTEKKSESKNEALKDFPEGANYKFTFGFHSLKTANIAKDAAEKNGYVAISDKDNNVSFWTKDPQDAIRFADTTVNLANEDERTKLERSDVDKAFAIAIKNKDYSENKETIDNATSEYAVVVHPFESFDGFSVMGELTDVVDFLDAIK